MKKIIIDNSEAGCFDLYLNGEEVKFRSPKEKKLLALCMDHCGEEVTMEDAIDKLWENIEHGYSEEQRYRVAVLQLRVTLRKYQLEGLLRTKRGACYIDESFFIREGYSVSFARRKEKLLGED